MNRSMKPPTRVFFPLNSPPHQQVWPGYPSMLTKSTHSICSTHSKWRTYVPTRKPWDLKIVWKSCGTGLFSFTLNFMPGPYAHKPAGSPIITSLKSLGTPDSNDSIQYPLSYLVHARLEIVTGTSEPLSAVLKSVSISNLVGSRCYDTTLYTFIWFQGFNGEYRRRGAQWRYHTVQHLGLLISKSSRPSYQILPTIPFYTNFRQKSLATYSISLFWTFLSSRLPPYPKRIRLRHHSSLELSAKNGERSLGQSQFSGLPLSFTSHDPISPMDVLIWLRIGLLDLVNFLFLSAFSSPYSNPNR